MRRAVSSSSAVVGALVLGLGLSPLSPVGGRGALASAARTVMASDLDAFSDAQLDRDLQDELDDVFEEHKPGDVGEVAEMQAELVAALKDDGDTGAEAEISFADLEDEMKEAGTTVEDVVHDALEHLDHASLSRPDGITESGEHAVDGSFKPSYGLAVRDVKVSVIREIRKSR